jgi:hypothetical protein
VEDVDERRSVKMATMKDLRKQDVKELKAKVKELDEYLGRDEFDFGEAASYADAVGKTADATAAKCAKLDEILVGAVNGAEGTGEGEAQPEKEEAEDPEAEEVGAR